MVTLGTLGTGNLDVDVRRKHVFLLAVPYRMVFPFLLSAVELDIIY